MNASMIEIYHFPTSNHVQNDSCTVFVIPTRGQWVNWWHLSIDYNVHIWVLSLNPSSDNIWGAWCILPFHEKICQWWHIITVLWFSKLLLQQLKHLSWQTIQSTCRWFMRNIRFMINPWPVFINCNCLYDLSLLFNNKMCMILTQDTLQLALNSSNNFEIILMIGDPGIPCTIALRWMSWYLTYHKSTLV